MDSILKNIEAVRKAKHIKQEQIAAELGIKQSSYICILRNGPTSTVRPFRFFIIFSEKPLA